MRRQVKQLGYDTVLHILSAMRGWGELLAGRPQQPHITGRFSAEQLLKMHEEIADDFGRAARAFPVDEIVTGERGGRSFSFARGAVITHVTTHGMHHRAQCLNMLRQLGIEQPMSAVVQWVLTADST